MAIAEYPLPSVNSSYPDPLFFKQVLPEAFNVGFTEYDDNGRDFKLQNGGNGIKRWVLRYDGLTEAQAAIIDTHMASAKLNAEGLSAIGFNFRDKFTAVLYSACHYEKYEGDHSKRWSQSRTVQIVKFA